VHRDFLSFIRRPADLLKTLGKITLGSAIAATGVAATPSPATAASSPGTVAPQALRPTIVDRARKTGKLVLQLPGTTAAFLRADHRSHRSHSSHRSHFSSSGGGATAPAPAPAPPVTRTPPRPAPGASTLDLSDSTAQGIFVSGEVISISTVARTMIVRQSTGVSTVFAYRDDSKFQSGIGVAVRFDDFSGENNGRLPVATRDKVQISWRMSPDGKTRIVSTVKKTP